MVRTTSPINAHVTPTARRDLLRSDTGRALLMLDERRTLYVLKRNCNLTALAMDSGYADSAHFSNSVRDAYGYKPREFVIAGRAIPTFRYAAA